MKPFEFVGLFLTWAVGIYLLLLTIDTVVYLVRYRRWKKRLNVMYYPETSFEDFSEHLNNRPRTFFP